MPNFSLKYPFFIIMACLVIVVVGVVSIASMPVDLFPQIDNASSCSRDILFWNAPAADRS